jgi:hypothetical protein
MKKKNLRSDYRAWCRFVLFGMLTVIALICLADLFLDLGLNRNVYVVSFSMMGAALGLLCLIWVSFQHFANGRDETLSVQQGEHDESQYPITLEDIEMCIRREGYIPQRVDDYIMFKISGEEFNVFYNDSKLSLVKMYNLDPDMDVNKILSACSSLHDSIFLVRSSIHRYEGGENALLFEVQALTETKEELLRYFARHLSLLFHGINRHKEIYNALIQDGETPERSDEQELPQISLPSNGHKVLS